MMGSGDGWWLWLHNINVLNTTHWTVHLKMVKMVNFMLHAFYHTKNVLLKEKKQWGRNGQFLSKAWDDFFSVV